MDMAKEKAADMVMENKDEMMDMAKDKAAEMMKDSM